MDMCVITYNENERISVSTHTCANRAYSEIMNIGIHLCMYVYVFTVYLRLEFLGESVICECHGIRCHRSRSVHDKLNFLLTLFRQWDGKAGDGVGGVC